MIHFVAWWNSFTSGHGLYYWWWNILTELDVLNYLVDCLFIHFLKYYGAELLRELFYSVWCLRCKKHSEQVVRPSLVHTENNKTENLSLSPGDRNYQLTYMHGFSSVPGKKTGAQVDNANFTWKGPSRVYIDVNAKPQKHETRPIKKLYRLKINMWWKVYHYQ